MRGNRVIHLLYTNSMIDLRNYTQKQLSAEDISNMDETAFCLDSKKSQKIAPEGSKAYKITQGGGRENVTIVGVVNASRKVPDPVIINHKL